MKYSQNIPFFKKKTLIIKRDISKIFSYKIFSKYHSFFKIHACTHIRFENIFRVSSHRPNWQTLQVLDCTHSRL